jgi:hypothetical protein
MWRSSLQRGCRMLSTKSSLNNYKAIRKSFKHSWMVPDISHKIEYTMFMDQDKEDYEYFYGVVDEEYLHAVESMLERGKIRDHVYEHATQVMTFPKLGILDKAKLAFMFSVEELYKKKVTKDPMLTINAIVEFAEKKDVLEWAFLEAFNVIMTASPEKLKTIVSSEVYEAIMNGQIISTYRSEDEEQNAKNIKLIYPWIMRFFHNIDMDAEMQRSSNHEEMKANFPPMYADVCILYLERRKFSDISHFDSRLSFEKNDLEKVLEHKHGAWFFDEDDSSYIWQLCQAMCQFKSTRMQWDLNTMSSRAVFNGPEFEPLMQALRFDGEKLAMKDSDELYQILESSDDEDEEEKKDEQEEKEKKSTKN